MPLPTVGYCTDEQIALRAGADFEKLAPTDQITAAGNDGVFITSDRWTLRSASNSFTGQGVQPGQVAILSLPIVGGVEAWQQFVVAQVNSTGAVLRRKGMLAGQGLPPGPTTGTTGAKFRVVTMASQILTASYDLERRFGVDDLVSGRRRSDLYDPTELVDACVLGVLVERYAMIARLAGDGAKDGQDAAYWAKRSQFKIELSELLARVVVKWAAPTSCEGPVRNNGMFTMRIGR